MNVLALEFPSISHLTNWPEIAFGLNKVGLIYIFATIATLAIFLIGGSKKKLVPKGIQNIAETSIDFVDNQIIMQTIGPDGRGFLPLLTSMFFFIFFSNITEVIPGVQFPANARFGIPLVLAVMVWAIYWTVGFIKQGPLHYIKNSTMPPGVPFVIKYFLVFPIELLQILIVRPFSQAVRLFANMLAGHLILVTFGVLCATLFALKPYVVLLPFTFLLLVFLTAFEVLVSFLQAFIFTILTAVYIGSSMHPDH